MLQMRFIVNSRVANTGGVRRSLALQDTEGTPWHTMHSTASITASATFGHSASPDNVTWWHIMARQGAMQVYVKYLDNFCHHNSLYFHHL